MNAAPPYAPSALSPQASSPPEGIFPLSARQRPGSVSAQGPWGPVAAPVPAALRAPVRVANDPASLVRSVTGAVVAVSAAMRSLNAALEGAAQDPATVDRAMAALNAAVADQALTARRVLQRFEAAETV